MSRKYPLEIILRHTGTAELVDGNDVTIWSSDSDPDFKEVVSQDFLTEDDADAILEYLCDAEYLSDAEAARFEADEWDVTEESLSDDSDDIDTDDDDESEDDDESFLEDDSEDDRE